MHNLLTEVIHEIEGRKAMPELKMQDVSNWQKDVNIETEAKAAGISVIAVKATEGTGYVSPSFQTQWKAAKVDGLGRIAYHYFHPSVSPTAQARAFLNEVKDGGLLANDCLAMDLEVNDGLTPAETAACAVQFKDTIQAETKCSLIVYTFLNFARTGHCAGLGNQPLWIADPSSPAGNPQVPDPWNTLHPGLWTFHQYGVVKGIDADICNFDSLTTLYKFAIIPPPPPLTPTQRMVQLSDGKTSKETLVDIGNIKAGFSMACGDAIFRVTEGGA